MKTGSDYVLVFRRRQPNGTPATGKLISDFIINAYLDGSPFSLSAALAEVETAGTWQVYALSFTMPGTPGQFRVYVETASGSDQIAEGAVDETLETVELSDLYDIIASPVVSVLTPGGPQGDISLRVVQKDYAVIAFTVRDQAGNAYDLSGWDNPQFGVKSADQTTVTYLTASVTMTSGGLVTIVIPESATVLWNALAVGVDALGLRFSFNADEDSDTTKTRTLARGPITLLRQETR